MSQPSDSDDQFSDALQHFPPDTPPSTTGLRRRKAFHFKSISDCFPNVKGYNFTKQTDLTSINYDDLSSLTDDVSLDHQSSVDYRLTKKETDADVSDLADDVSVDYYDRSVGSVSSALTSVITLTKSVITIVVYCKISLLRVLVTFLLWLTHTSCMFVTDPLTVMARAKSHVTGIISRVLKLCLGNVKWVVYCCIKKKKLTWKFCLNIGWGLVCAVFVGLVLFGLFVLAFVVGGGVVMRFVVEAPMSRIAQLNFDYTRGAPVAFVPLMSCFERVCLDCDDKIGVDSVGLLRVVPRDRKLKGTVSLTLPESGYNRNLGNFQVRVDFLSSNGRPLATATQPCTMRFKSWPIRLIKTVFKLVPLLTGYSSESQTVDMKFDKYIEQEIPTSCIRVMLEPRAEYARSGGVPEIYTAHLKLESQLPLLKNLLWSWKATLFVWTSIAIFKLIVLIMLLCCAPWLRLKSDPHLNNTGSR